MISHLIAVQSWGGAPVVVCISRDCIDEKNPNGVVLARGNSSIPIGMVFAGIEKHTGEAAFRAS